MSRTIVVAAGHGQRHTDAAFEEALSRSTKKDDIYVIKVLTDRNDREDSASQSFGFFERLNEKCKEKNRKCHFRTLESRYTGVDSFGVNYRANIGATICTAASSINATDLIMGYRSLTSADRLLMGSVAGYCVKHCQLPVTIVKHDS